MKSFEELGINVDGINVQGKTTCPHCSSKRKKSWETCLSVNIDTGQFHCFNCGWSGSTKPYDGLKERYAVRDYMKPSYNTEELELSEEVVEYFAGRGISEDTLQANLISSINLPDGRTAIQFPFIKEEVVNIKTRSLDKQFFKMVRGAEACFYGIQNLFDEGYLATKKVFITEGEIDTLSLYECGFIYSISVPNGAGVEEEGHRPITPRLEYLDDPDISYILENVDQVVLVTDADYKGKRLKDELAQRIGVDKCFYVEYPAGCKDINDVLKIHGKDAVTECIIDAKPMLSGLVTVSSLNGEITAYYAEGLQAGMESGIEDFDEIYTLKEGLITLVTGVPEVKKSIFLDNLTAGYAHLHGVRTAYFSPETKPVQFHIGRLASIHNGKSLDINAHDRMSYQEYTEAVKWVNQNYVFLQPPHATLPEILQLAKLAVLRHGVKVIVIDPYSRIRVETEREDKFIRDMLTDLSEFAVRYGVHIFVVAHPTKTETMGRGGTATDIKNYPIITPYMIKGAAEWYNSSDFILSLWKDVTIEDAPIRVYCLKSKYYHIAKSYKFVELDYHYKNWRLTSHDYPQFSQAAA